MVHFVVNTTTTRLTVRRILPILLRQHRLYGIIAFLTLFWSIGSIVTLNRSDYIFLPPPSSMIWTLIERPSDWGDERQISTIEVTPEPYIIDTLCSGCRHSIADPNNPNSERCGYYIQQQYSRHKQRSDRTTTSTSSNGSTVHDAAVVSVIGDMIAQQFPIGCSKCQGRQQQQKSNVNESLNEDEVCTTMNQFQYWRYDSVVTSKMIRSSFTHDQWFSSSKPKQHHLTATTTTTNTSLLNTSFYYGTNIPIIPRPRNPVFEYYMEYNPSIVILPKNQYKLLQFPITTTTTPKHSNDKYYVISFRISNQNYCFHPKDQPKRHLLLHPQSLNISNVGQDYLGIVIVKASSSSSIFEDVLYETIVDLKAIRGFQIAQDFRLFVLQNQLYISSFDTITPLWLTTISTAAAAAAATNPRKDTILVPPAFLKNNTFNHRQHLDVWIRKSLSCVNCHRKRGHCGKNFNYFMDDNESLSDFINTSNARVELWPTGPHTVHSVDLNKPCRRQLEPTTKYIGSDQPNIPSTFATLEELDFPALGRMESILTRGRGSACCIPMTYPKNSTDTNINRTVLVGIQHTKTPSQRNKILPPTNVMSNHYLSSFYAFESKPPYNIIAQTGWFCLGFPTFKDTNGTTVLERITAWRKLLLGGRTYNCPRIHFVSGMTMKANDPNTVILAYGINDCYSRFVEIQLSDIYDLLFIGPSV